MLLYDVTYLLYTAVAWVCSVQFDRSALTILCIISSILIAAGFEFVGFTLNLGISSPEKAMTSYSYKCVMEDFMKFSTFKKS